jgi:translocation and assembly module TamB
MKKFFLKTSLIFLASLLVIILLLIVFSQTVIFKNWAKDYAMEKVNLVFNGDFNIGKLSGNLFTRIELTGITFVQNDDTLLYLEKIDLSYKPFRFLKKEIFLKSLRLVKPKIKIKQLADSSWNFNDLLLQDSTQQIESKSRVRFPYIITLSELQLLDGKIDFETSVSILPKLINDIYIRLSGIYSHDFQKIEIQKFSLNTKGPDFGIEELVFSLSKDSESVSLNNFSIRTKSNKVQVDGRYSNTNFIKSEIELASEPINISEFQFFLPPIHLKARPSLKLSSHIYRDSLGFTIRLHDTDQKITIEGELHNVNNVWQNSDINLMSYNLEVTLQNFDTEQWFFNDPLHSILNANFHIHGRGFGAENADFQFDLNFKDCHFYERPISDLTVNGKYANGDLSGIFNLNSNWGDIILETNISDIQKSQKFKTEIFAKKLNLANLLFIDTLQSDLNFHLSAVGQNFNPKLMSTNLHLNVSTSKIMDYSIDSLISDSQFRNEILYLDSLKFMIPSAILRLEGITNLNTQNKLNYLIEVQDFSPFQTVIQADSLRGSGIISGHFEGKLDSFMLNSNFQFDRLEYNNLGFTRTDGNLSFLRSKDAYHGASDIHIRGAEISNILIDTLALNAKFDDNIFDLNSNFTFRDIHTSLLAQVTAGEITKINLPKLEIKKESEQWSGGTDSTVFVIEQNTIHINNFYLKTITKDSLAGKRGIFIDGFVSPSGEENLDIEITALDLSLLNSILELPVQTKGKFNLQMSLKGDASDPLLNGMIDIKNGYVDEYFYNELYGNFNYKSKKLNWDISINPNKSDSVIFTGSLPMNLSLTDTSEFIDKKAPFLVNVRGNNLPLGLFLLNVKNLENVKGIIDCDLKIQNTLQHPLPNGYLKIKDGKFMITDLGIDYSDIQININAKDGKIFFDNLSAKREDGIVKASGYLELDSTYISGIVNSAQFKLIAENFYIARHKDFEIKIAADTELQGDKNNPTFGGTVKVLKSNFHIPTLLELTGNKSLEPEMTTPLLVLATQQSQEMRDSLISEIETKIRPEEQSRFLKNLRGKLKFSIPENSWIISPTMRVEIKGDLDLIKTPVGFELFGSINIIRGYYNLFNRRFTIEKGKLTFSGGKEFNPQILLEAEYSFRTSTKESRELRLSLSGKLLNPSLFFTLDGREISQSDAVSYVLFGRSRDELTYGQQTEISGATGQQALAMDVASSLVSSQLTKTLGNDLSIDMIEIKSRDNWQNATFVVGKYITNDLFVSYERDFGNSTGDEFTPETIVVEYELTRKIFLQVLEGNSKTKGFDLIFKIERY